MLRAGQMRDLVTLLVPSQQIDPRFGPSGKTFVPGPQVWANVVCSDGTEQWQDNDDGVQSYAVFTIRMYYRPDINNQYRIKFQGKTLELLAVMDPDSRQRELTIKARQYPGAC
jgi:SPP1 family predicted phage head-tail adaptor